MNNTNFWIWLFSDAGAGWVFGIISTSVLIVSFFRRAKPQRIIFRDTNLATLVSVRRTAKEKISISFDGKPVKNLSQFESEIYNEGVDVIKDVVIDLFLPEDTRLLDFSYRMEAGDLGVSWESVENKIVLHIPYLNPYKVHGQKLDLSLIVDGDLEKMKIQGSGEGWSIRRLPVLSLAQYEKRLFRVMVATLLLGVGLLAYNIFIEYWIGIPQYEIRIRSTIVNLPVILSAFGLLYWGMIRGLSPSERRRIFKLLFPWYT